MLIVELEWTLEWDIHSVTHIYNGRNSELESMEGSERVSVNYVLPSLKNLFSQLFLVGLLA